ncbi:MAG: aminotransferase class V-fold PLP-dependent enzyme [Desulfamplus sp.]|nr:aminotransferase class V-fold PLP-dependent enzyme [Desulfamplus sp.]
MERAYRINGDVIKERIRIIHNNGINQNAGMNGITRFDGIEAEGFAQALNAYSLEKAVVLVSKRGHFSLKKSGGILGIGNKNVIPIDVNAQYRMDVIKLSRIIKDIKKQGKTGIISVVGVAGATETGIVDPLTDIGDICKDHGINFHVDAAWGGPVMLSEKYSHKLKGIELADSVTVDGHKQFFMPMTCGMVFFRDPLAMNHIAYHSNYVNRQGSVDLGIKTLEGSREANSLILDSALKIMGTKGYALMIDHGIETAKQFAEAIKKRELFELVTEPELNILTYRMVPNHIRKSFETADSNEKRQLNAQLDKINIAVQRKQRESGKSFVSRTRMNYGGMARESDKNMVYEIDKKLDNQIIHTSNVMTDNSNEITHTSNVMTDNSNEITHTSNTMSYNSNTTTHTSNTIPYNSNETTYKSNNSVACEEIVVLRSVIMNPMTSITILNEVLDEQERILKNLLKEC